MTTIECKNCGAAVTLAAGQTTGTCEYCGSTVTLTATDTFQTATTVNIQSLLKRIELFLEDGDWNDAKEYCEKVLDENPECAQAYLYKLMAKLKAHNQTELMLCDRALFSMKNYQKAVRFADSELKNVLEELSLNNRYHTAQLRMDEAATEAEYKFAAQLFGQISTFKDSAQQKEKCLELMEEARKAAIEKEAQNKLELEKQNELTKQKAINRLKTIRKYISIAAVIFVIVFLFRFGVNRFIIYPQIYEKANTLSEEGKLKDAAITFNSLGRYKDSRERCFKLWGMLTEKNSKVMVDYGITATLNNDGTVTVTGDKVEKYNTNSWINIVSISAGDDHIVGLKANGNVVATGYDFYDQCNTFLWRDIVAIYANDNYTVGLKSDGTIEVSGDLNGMVIETWEDRFLFDE